MRPRSFSPVIDSSSSVWALGSSSDSTYTLKKPGNVIVRPDAENSASRPSLVSAPSLTVTSPRASSDATQRTEHVNTEPLRIHLLGHALDGVLEHVDFAGQFLGAAQGVVGDGGQPDPPERKFAAGVAYLADPPSRRRPDARPRGKTDDA